LSYFVKFWGTRGSIPTPGHATRKYGGNTSCVEIRVGDRLLICDAGTGLRELGLDLQARGITPIRGHFFFSHTHWDHIQGFPFFSPIYDPANTFTIYGEPGEDNRVHRLLSGQMRAEYFPVDFHQLASTLLKGTLNEDVNDIDGVRVKTWAQPHPGGSVAYSFEAEGAKVVYATDSELDERLLNAEDVERNPAVMRQLPQDLLDFVADADLLIADAQYTDEEYPSHVGWGHARASTTVDLALQGRVRQLALFHHDPMQSDRDMDAKVNTCRDRAAANGSDLVIFGAREGLELKIV
jgi:phosphoribosyl 1,2-cyclic phosphodiesterase